jgi:FkbM family methyltransferase
MSYLKNIIKKIFIITGFEVRRLRKHGEDRRTTLAEALFQISRKGFKPNTVIDVGVATGTYELYDTFPEAKHLLIEPLLEFEPYMKKISVRYDAEYVIAAAGPRKGTTTINVHQDLLGSSVYKETDGSYVDGISRKVPVVTIDALCNRRKLKGTYLIKVDVQGAERLVLNGARKVLKNTDVVILETHFFQFYIKGPQFYEIVSYMNNLGFVAYDIFGGYNRPTDFALASVDMVFVKEHGIFRKSHSFARRTQRKYLNKIVLHNALLHTDRRS